MSRFISIEWSDLDFMAQERLTESIAESFLDKLKTEAEENRKRWEEKSGILQTEWEIIANWLYDFEEVEDYVTITEDDVDAIKRRVQEWSQDEAQKALQKAFKYTEIEVAI